MVEREHDGLPQPEYTSQNWRQAVVAWRNWYDDYRSAHLRFSDPQGETVRASLENSYQPAYGDRYYARFKALERRVVSEYDDLHTAILTFTGSHRNANGGWRCPADHLREVVEAWSAGVKQELYRTLSDKEWEYARILEPHADGYGHVHMAIFVDGEIEAEDFRPVMRKHVEKCKIASSNAHRVNGNPFDSEDRGAVSVHPVDPDTEAEGNTISNLGTYLCEYLGTYGDDPTERPANEQLFYAVTWATGSRRLEFSNGAQDMITAEQRRTATGTRPEDRGEAQPEVRIDPEAETVKVTDGGAWSVDALVRVDHGDRSEYDPAGGGVEMKTIRGSESADPPPQVR